jgi:hypothetical protein
VYGVYLASRATRNIFRRCHQDDRGRKYQCVEKLGDYIEKVTVYLFLCIFCRIKKIIDCPYFSNSPRSKLDLRETWREHGGMDSASSI